MIALREIARADIPLVNAWRRDRDVLEGLAAPFRHIDIEVDQQWYDSYLARRGREVRCAICLPGGEMVGIVSLTGVDTVHRGAEMHIMIGPHDARNRGVGTAATREMLKHAFRDLNLHRLWLTVVCTNEAARRVYTKVGFRHEGTLRDAVYKDGRYLDQWLMAILSTEFNDAAPEKAIDG